MLVRHSTCVVDFSGPEPHIQEVEALNVKLCMSGAHPYTGPTATHIDIPLSEFLLLLDRARTFNELRVLLESDMVQPEDKAAVAHA